MSTTKGTDWQELVAAFVSSQHKQLGESNETEQQRTTTLTHSLCNDPSSFLKQHGSVLRADHLRYFDAIPSMETQRIMQSLIRNQRNGKSKKVVRNVRNRRLQYLKQLEEGDYFSEEKMAARRPALYEVYIGQYITSSEVQDKVNESNKGPWSSQLIDVIVNKDLRSRRDQVRENEKWPKLDTAEIDDVERDNVTTAPDRIQFKGEFERLMKEHFLAGDDQEFFDYSVVDNNSEYDDLDIKGRDAEEAYFDDSD
eukprot:m.83975 g.83975  ORF g.83975 m.83975 type:complete len:254 (-) comp12948_c0_seq1:109-870(-)